jgi:hypothetical protein
MRWVSLLVALALTAVWAAAVAADTPQLPVAVVALTSPVARGADARLTIKTSPHTQCELLVYYKAAPASINLAFPKRSDDQGRVSWTWRVDRGVTPGNWPLTVHCTDEFKGSIVQSRLEVPFTVR